MKNISLDKFNQFIKLNKLQEAEVEINKLLLIDDNNYLLLSYLGNLLFLQGNISGAIENFKKSINIKPDYFEAHLKRGMVLDALKAFNEALICYEKAIY